MLIRMVRLNEVPEELAFRDQGSRATQRNRAAGGTAAANFHSAVSVESAADDRRGRAVDRINRSASREPSPIRAMQFVNPQCRIIGLLPFRHSIAPPFEV